MLKQILIPLALLYGAHDPLQLKIEREEQRSNINLQVLLEHSFNELSGSNFRLKQDQKENNGTKSHLAQVLNQSDFVDYDSEAEDFQEPFVGSKDNREKSLSILTTSSIPVVSTLKQKLEVEEGSSLALRDIPDSLDTSLKRGLQMVYPLIRVVPITSGFGWRIHPIAGRPRFHSGVDLGATWGSPVIAAYSGKVIQAGWKGVQIRAAKKRLIAYVRNRSQPHYVQVPRSNPKIQIHSLKWVEH